MRKSNKNKSILLRVAAFIFIGFLVVNLGYQQIDYSTKARQLEAQQKEKEEKTMIKEELTRLLETSGDKEFIENAARQKLGYVYPNERVYYDSWGN